VIVAGAASGSTSSTILLVKVRMDAFHGSVFVVFEAVDSLLSAAGIRTAVVKVCTYIGIATPPRCVQE
jgi:hypothetical protein